MTDETKCPSCGHKPADVDGGKCCTYVDCAFYDCYFPWDIWVEIHRLRNTLPDGTELEPGDYRLKKVLRSGEVVAAEFTIPDPAKEPKSPIPEATLAIIRAAYPSADRLEWHSGRGGRFWAAHGATRRDVWSLDPALLPPWEGEVEPPVVSLREGE